MAVFFCIGCTAESLLSFSFVSLPQVNSLILPSRAAVVLMIGVYIYIYRVALAGILYHREDQLVYHPEWPANSRVYVPAPSILNLPYQSIYTRSGDGTMLHMFFISQPEDRAKKVPTLLFLHGNAGNMGHRSVVTF